MRNKLLRYRQISVANVFAKETQLIQQLQAGQLQQCLMLWQVNEPTLVLPAGKKWPASEQLKNELANEQWLLHSRKTGGAPVPQSPGVINLSHLYLWPGGSPYSIKTAYHNLCTVLQDFFQQFNITAQVHATAHSYCDGDFNLNVNGKKIVGTAQRVILKKGGEKIVLAQAFILIDVIIEELIKPVNLCYAVSAKTERVQAQVHTTLFDHIKLSTTYNKPSVESLYQKLTQAFVASGLY